MNKTNRFSKYSLVLTGLLSLGFCASEQVWALPSGIQVTAMGGVSRVSMKADDLVVSPTETDTLHKNNNNINEFTPAVGVAYNICVGNILDSVSIGLNAYYFQAQQKGDVFLFGDPAFNDYTYDLKLKSGRVMVDTEWNFASMWNGLLVFGQLGAGVAHNKLSYEDTPNPGIIGGGITLSSNTQNKFAYDAGLGIKMPATSNMILSLRYLYTNLGTSETSTDANLVTVEPLKVKASTQSLLLGLTVYFN